MFGGENMRWTYKENLYLKNHYNEMPIQEIERNLGRSASSIHSHIAYLRQRGWTFKRKTDAN
jgi:biotin operon repressor